MRMVAGAPLPPRVAARLAGWQREIDAIPAFADRVAEARRKFGSRNVKRNKTFLTIRQTLEAMCGSEVRCQYCEDNQADEIEHIAPKRLFPDRAFEWTNYLYACGTCNGPKNDRYAILDAAGQVVEVRRSMIPTPPPQGTAMLVNPRIEDPLDLMELDLSGPWATFALVPSQATDARSSARVVWTIAVLDLNSAPRRRARKSTFDFCVSHLSTYARNKADRVPQAQLDDMRGTILEMRHPTVFEAMRRQVVTDPELAALFAPIPEALTW